MSRTTAYLVPRVGKFIHYKEYHNSSRSAWVVWDALYKQYISHGADVYFLNKPAEMEKLWRLAHDPKLTLCERAVLVFTYDQVICEYDKLPDLADHMEEFYHLYPGYSHLPEMAADLRNIYCHHHADKLYDVYCKQLMGVCWQQTSVSENPWYVRDEDGEDGHLYDLSEDDEGHYFLYAKLEEPSP